MAAKRVSLTATKCLHRNVAAFPKCSNQLLTTFHSKQVTKSFDQSMFRRSLSRGFCTSHFNQHRYHSSSSSTRSIPHIPSAAVVTGASSGIGRQTAIQFAESGEWDVVHAVSRRPCNEPNIVSHSIDLNEIDGLSEALLPILDSFNGQLHRICVVHSAGVQIPDTAQNVSIEGMLCTMKVNCVAPALLSKALIPHMAFGSSIIYVGSTLSEIGVANNFSYAASKHATVGLMRATVQDLFGQGIHTACICPGFTDTAMLAKGLERASGGDSAKLAQISAIIQGMQSFGRLVTPSEIADMIETLSRSPAANGTVLHMNLGQKQS